MSFYRVSSILVIFLIITVQYYTFAAAVPHQNALERRLLIVSFDGFRWDFLKRLPNPNNFTRLIKGGVWAPDGIKNVFVTKTFGNHYSIASGLYEESSGIVSNAFWDPSYKRVISLKDPLSEQLDNLFAGDPIWTTYIQQTGEDLVGCYMWVGCLFKIKGIRPKRVLEYNDGTPWKQRVQTVVNWFVNDSIQLGLLYLPEPDITCHIHGPESEEVTAKIRRINDHLGYLLDQLEEHDLSSINIIVTSDHGMTTILNKTFIDLNDDLFDVLVKKDEFWHIRPKPGQEEETVAYLRKYPHTKVYRKNEIPVDYHYANNSRIPPVLLLPDYGWIIIDRNRPPSVYEKGTHGYNNSAHEMWPIFMAQGPAFEKDAHTLSDFQSVDVYNVMTTILGLNPAPNNGSMTRARSIILSKYYSVGAVVRAQVIVICIVVLNLCATVSWLL